MNGKRISIIGALSFLCLFTQDPAFSADGAWSASGDPIGAGSSYRQPASIPSSGFFGRSHGQALTSAPTADLCSAGMPSTVGGSGPWIWQCSGSGGGLTVDCISGLLTQEGDLNGDHAMDLADAILALKVMTRVSPTGIMEDYPNVDVDITGDGRIGMPDLIAILQRIAALRTMSTNLAVGSVTLPAGSSFTFADVQVQSFLGKTVVHENGTYAIRQPSTGPALVMLTNAQGNIMLLGYADSGDPYQMGKISSLSTAATLMFLDIGGVTLPGDSWKTVLALIETEQSVKDLAAVIEIRLALDSGALENGDEAIKTAIRTARTALTSPSSTAAMAGLRSSASLPVRRTASSTDPVEITVISQNPASGIQVSGDPNGDGLLIQNSYRRHCYYWLYYTGYQDKDGSDHLLSTALWEKLDDGYLKSTSGLSGVLGTSLDYFIWKKLPYDLITVGPFILDKAPTDAKHAYYKAVVVGGTMLDGYLPPAWVTENVNRIDYMAMQNLMGTVSVVKDYFLPLTFALASKNATDSLSGKELADLCSLLTGFFIRAGVNVTQNIAANDYDGAWRAMQKAFLADGELRKAVCRFVASRLLKYALSAERIEQLTASAKNINGILKGLDIAMLSMDLGSVTNDLGLSNGYDLFEVIAVKPNIHIEPRTAKLGPKYEKTFNAIKGTVTGDTFEYRWTVTGVAGSLHLPGKTDLANALTTSTPSIVYKVSATPTHNAHDTITVDVYRKLVTADGVVTQFVGQNQSVVTIWNDQIPVTFHYVEPWFSNKPHPGSWGTSKYSYFVMTYYTWPAVKESTGYNITVHGQKNDSGVMPDWIWEMRPQYGLNRWIGDDPGRPYPEIPVGMAFYGGAQDFGISTSPEEDPGWWETICNTWRSKHVDTMKDAVLTAVPVF